MKQHFDIRSCLESWECELSSRANRVRRLIGDRHWLSDGKHKEALVSEFLKRHLPNTLNITSGFVVNGASKEGASQEIDVLVSDFTLESPWFHEGELAIITPTSCVAQIHVKTETKTAEFESVFGSCNHSSKVMGETHSERCFFGGIFFPSQETLKVSNLEKTLRNIRKRSQNTDRLPDVIAIIGGPVIIRRKDKLFAYELKNLSLAIFLTQLRMFSSAKTNDPHDEGEISYFLRQLQYTKLFEF